jgi:hypothetical protein
VLGVIPITALDVRIDVAPLANGTVPAVRAELSYARARAFDRREWVARGRIPARRSTRSPRTLHADYGARWIRQAALIDPIPTIELGARPGDSAVVTVRTRPIRIFKTKQQTESAATTGCAMSPGARDRASALVRFAVASLAIWAALALSTAPLPRRPCSRAACPDSPANALRQ